MADEVDAARQRQVEWLKNGGMTGARRNPTADQQLEWAISKLQRIQMLAVQSPSSPLTENILDILHEKPPWGTAREEEV